MRRILTLVVAAFCLVCGSTSLGALKNPARKTIAVAEPRARSGVKAEDVAGISDYLESKLGVKYDVYSRASLNEMLKEEAFNNSGMVLDDATKQQLAQVAVDYLLSYSITASGGRITMTITVINRATGAVIPGGRSSFFAQDINGLYAGIDDALNRMGMLDVAQQQTMRIAIMPTKGSATTSPVMLQGFSSKLGESLQASGLFEIVTRTDLETIGAESSMLNKSNVNQDDLYKIARLNVADYLVITELPDYNSRVVGTSGGSDIAGASLSSGRLQMSSRTEFRVVEVKTGKIMAQGSFHYVLKSTDINASVRRDWEKADYDNAFCERVAVKVSRKILDAIDPIVVVAVDGNQVYLSRSSGVLVGEEFEIRERGKEAVNSITGRSLGILPGRKLATCRVTGMSGQMAIAQLLAKPVADIQAGAECKLVEWETTADSAMVPQAPAAPAYPMAF
ncbi:MAG: CsgG/HfaB family protein [Victivallaceae bacterium]|nr:CsgG/HfaB family protein [Victivallaceae bacterium]